MLGEVQSASEAERIIKQRGFENDGATIQDATCKLDFDQNGTYKVRVGKKKFLRIIVE